MIDIIMIRYVHETIIRFYECLIYLKAHLLKSLKISIKIYDIKRNNKNFGIKL